jgi:cellulose synthase/poly-beta-1,6-N-acetylglucosamine synthase-like glycosyltransferase
LGGWDESVLAEDTELTFRIRLAGHRIWYDNSAECYEEAVATWRAYWRQRSRWSKGHMQVAFKYWPEVIRSRKLSLKEKVDGLLLLNVYFMPILVLFSWIIGIMLLAFNSILWSDGLWFLVPLSIYSFAGNFAPLFEVGIGAYLDGRKRAQWLIPFLIFTFLFNIVICTKAFVDVMISRMRQNSLLTWDKTVHAGNVKVKRE